MKPQIGEIWEPEYETRFGPIEILSEEMPYPNEGCYSVKFLTGVNHYSHGFKVIGGEIPFKCSKQVNLENK